MGASSTEIYEAVVELSRSIAGRDDLESLLYGVRESLRRIVACETVGLILHDVAADRTKGYIVRRPGIPLLSLCFPAEEDPAGLVWLTQRPLVIPCIDTETRWPGFIERCREAGIQAVTLVPLTSGANRLGALGFGAVAPFGPNEAELAFLQRVASELAVAVEAFLAKQELTRERDRLRTLFDITNALVAKLSHDELFAAISAQLSRVVQHDFSLLTLRTEDGGLQMVALHFTGKPLFEKDEADVNPEDMHAGEALATGKPVVLHDLDVGRYPSSHYQRFVDAGCKSVCSIPLSTSNGALGTLEIGRTTADSWADEDVDFLVQVGRQVAIAVENALAYRQLSDIKERLATEKLYLEDEIRFDHNIGNMVGSGPAFQAVLRSVQIVAPTDATVLILGETGTGKELVARAIHEMSHRSKGNFVKVNCAAIPASLLESELFGHEKGSFTGAVAQKIGRFELADQGTLFLDEIGEMPLELQPKLLRAIQDQEFERVGGTRTIRTNVRFIAATNRDLKTMVEENRFRGDLYYRLHVFPLNVPPLRERREDIPLLTRYFVQKHAHRMGRKIDRIPNHALEALASYHWPGNIRELQNVIERSVIVSNGMELNLAMPESHGKPVPALAPSGGAKVSEAIERARILQALKDAKGMVGGPNGAAARLGLKRTTLQSRMRKYNISRQYL
ncbi:MAG: sigma 54-interacting transcriptional regulator [Bryobacteraceae bacterium]|nr:sigma 54-interacting transcriptional regulator [Bryobacteraceae bacterium]